MTKQKDQESPQERLAWAYRRMVERVWDSLSILDKKTTPLVKKAIEKARIAAVDLDELSQEEADTVAEYLQRDLQDAVEFVAETGKGLKDWMAFDWMLVENKLWTMFSSVADKAYLQMLQLNQKLQGEAKGYRAHEVVGVGTLQCGQCGELQHFHTIGQIMPCPKCHGVVFVRFKKGDDKAGKM